MKIVPLECLPLLGSSKIAPLILLSFLVWIVPAAEGLPKVYRTNEICGVYNGHRVYLELGDRGQLQASNVTFPRQANQTTPLVCSLELVTCPSCNFKISLSYTNFPTKCAVHNESPCHCDYLEFSEPPFDSEQSGRRNCGQDVVYQTQTRTVLIRFLAWNNHSHAFTLEYVAERNRETLQANPGGVHNLTMAHTKTISTPYFPSYYPRDFGKEYVVSCSVEDCRINVIFSDFQLAKTSTMEFYDWNGQRLGAVSGSSFRPPVVQSSGPSMIIRFYANGGSGLGYMAKVSFLTLESAANPLMLPDTNCGGMVDNIGGAITMMKMVSLENETRLFDCIWLIKPPNTYAHLKTHLSLKVDTFEKMGINSLLTVIQGTTSDNAILDVIRPNLAGQGRNFIVPLTSGLYVHLKASFGFSSRMALVYAAFSYLDCYMGSEFLCKNRKCIPIQLHCDGFDHCGDASDEPESCEAQWEIEPIDRRWYSHTPNYYFPKMDRYPDLRTATIIFIASSLGLITLISALIVLLYRTGDRARQQRELQSQLQTISELLDNNNTHGAEEVDEPPMYEAPPDYDEIIKVGMDDDIKRKHRRRSSSASGRRSRMRRQRRSSNVSDSHNPILEVRLPPDISDGPSTSATLRVPYSDDCQLASDMEDDELYDQHWNGSEPNFFITSRILEATASTSTSQSYSVGCQTAGTATTGSTSSPPPTYDDSQFQRSGILSLPDTSRSTSNSDNISRGFAEEAPHVTLSLKGTPRQSAERIIPPPCIPGSSGSQLNASNVLKKPQHMWSESSRAQRPWLAFSSDEPQVVATRAVADAAVPRSSTNYCEPQTFDSVDLSQIHEIDAYLLAYGATSTEQFGCRSPGAISNEHEITSNSTDSSRLPSTASFVRNSCVCSSAGSATSDGYSYIGKNCPRCRETLSFPNSQCPNCNPNRTAAVPASICSTCGGKISLMDSLSSSTGSTQQPAVVASTVGATNGDPQPVPPTLQSSAAVKLCNCFPRFPSQSNMVRTGSANVLSNRPLSADRVDAGNNPRRSVANLTNSFEAFFNSHIGFPSGSDRRS